MRKNEIDLGDGWLVVGGGGWHWTVVGGIGWQEKVMSGGGRPWMAGEGGGWQEKAPMVFNGLCVGGVAAGKAEIWS